MGKIKDGKLLYHLTKLSNLDSILEIGLVSRQYLEEKKNNFSDVADFEIIQKRKECELNKYIPFHFHPHSSFDIAVKNNYQNDDFIYICISRSKAKAKGFLILPKHPLSIECVDLLEYDEGFKAIDWERMEGSSTESEEHKKVRMAECLTDKMILANEFQSIAVKDEKIKKIVIKKLNQYKIENVHVDIRKWCNT